MRAPRAGRWGQERKELGGRLGRGAKEERRKAFFRPPPSPLSTLTHHPNVHSAGDVYVQGRASPLTHTCPWMQRMQSSGISGCPRPVLAKPPHSPLFSLHFMASFTGLVSTEGWGAIALYYLRENAGEGRKPRFTPSPSASAPPQPSPHGSLSFSPMCFIEAPTSNPSRSSLRFPGSLPSPKAWPAPPHVGGAAHMRIRISESVLCVRRGLWGPGLGTLPLVPVATEQPRSRDSSEPLPHIPPETQTHPSSQLWGFSLL